MTLAIGLMVLLIEALLAGSVVALTVLALGVLWVYGQHVRRYRRGRRIEAGIDAASLPGDAALPAVLVQIPVYYEARSVSRALEAAARLDWPRDRLSIQLLDDSHDETTSIALAKATELVDRGVAVEVLHRDNRSGFKAGAMAAGLERSSAPFVLILDVDYLPPPDMIRRCIRPLLLPGLVPAKLGFVQARWGYVNPDANAITRLQALNLDAHFVVEQTGRCWSGLPMGFNGTCGIWRREAIDAAGGWQGDCLAEDLDLALRAYLVGWRGWLLLDVEVPGELPESPRAWKVQQSRWTRGMAGVARKLLPRIWRAPLPMSVKVATTLHLGLSAAVPLTAIAFVCILGLLALKPVLSALAPAILLLTWTVAVIFGTARGQWVLGRFALPRYLQSLLYTIFGYLVVAVVNARGVAATFAGARSVFERTPKTGEGGPADTGDTSDRERQGI